MSKKTKGIDKMGTEEIKKLTKEEYVQILFQEAGTNKKLTYGQIGDSLDKADIDKEEIDNIYEELLRQGIEIVSEEEDEEEDFNMESVDDGVNDVEDVEQNLML